jgi:hypothetical protein
MEEEAPRSTWRRVTTCVFLNVGEKEMLAELLAQNPIVLINKISSQII